MKLFRIVKRTVITLSFIVAICFVALEMMVCYDIVDEEYRRFASDRLPPGERVNWQSYVGYPADYGALREVLVCYWLPISIVLATALFLLRLVWIGLVRHNHSCARLPHILDILFGVPLALVTGLVAASHRSAWVGRLPVCLFGYGCSVLLLLAPIYHFLRCRSAHSKHIP
jgi:hypothetical protein